MINNSRMESLKDKILREAEGAQNELEELKKLEESKKALRSKGKKEKEK